MYIYTGVKCQELCEEAIRLAPDNKTKGYIHSYWLETSSKWALYARQHSPMLLQTTTTNACESWHRQLKTSLGVDKGKAADHGRFLNLNLSNSESVASSHNCSGIHGMVLHIMQSGKEQDKRAGEAAWKFMNRKLSVCTKNYPEIGGFPVPIQKLLAQELDAVEGRLEQGKPVPGLDASGLLMCHCRYLLHSESMTVQ